MLIVLPFAQAEETITCEPFQLCDAHANGVINEMDAYWILDYVVGNVEICGNENNSNYCDVNNDGEVNSYDAALVLNYVAESNTEPEEIVECEGHGMCDAFADGTINNLDYEWILEYTVGNYDFCGNNQNNTFCDVNNDGEVTAYDASLVLQYVNQNTINETPSCTFEGDTTNPSLGPNYFTPCCSGLELFYLGQTTNENGIIETQTGSPSVCYNPNEEEPVCMILNDIEGWYYLNGDLLIEYDCHEDSIPPVDYETHILAVSDYSPVTDVNIAMDLKDELEEFNEVTLFSELEDNSFNTKVTLLIYYNEAVIVLGATSPADQAEFARTLKEMLNDINVKSSIITSDLIDTTNLEGLFSSDISHTRQTKTNKIQTAQSTHAAIILNQENHGKLYKLSTGISQQTSSQQGTIEKTYAVSEKEIKGLSSTNGAEIRFMQLQVSIKRAITGQYVIIEWIKENHPDIDTTDLEAIKDKLMSLLDRTSNLKDIAKEDYLQTFQSIKVEAKELISIFKEATHKLITEEEVELVKNKLETTQKTAAIEIMDREVKEKIKVYNNEKIKEEVKNLNVEDETREIIDKINEGNYIDYSEIKKQIAQKISELDADLQKEINLKMNEAKIKTEVTKEAALEKLKGTNLDSIKANVRNQITTSNGAN